MYHVNILWPEEYKKEFLGLFSECSDLLTEEESENENVFSIKLNEYINAHASNKLKEWLRHVKRINA